MISLKRIAAVSAAFILSVGIFSYGYAEEYDFETDDASVQEDQSSEDSSEAGEYDFSDVIWSEEEDISYDDEQSYDESREDYYPDYPEDSADSPAESEEDYSYESEDASSYYYYEDSDSSEYTWEPAPQQEDADDTDQGDSPSIHSEALDVSPYTDQLEALSEKQKELDERIKNASLSANKQDELEEALAEQIDTINEKLNVLNSYMTSLEFSMSTNQRAMDAKQREIDKGIENFKKRLRALYLLGETSYADVLLGSEDFYDVLMRLDLIKSVAEFDSKAIDDLTREKDELAQIQAQHEAEEQEYLERMTELESEKENLDNLYNRTKRTREKLEKEIKLLDEQQEAYNAERQAFEEEMSDIMKSSYGDSDEDKTREAAELAANDMLAQLHAGIADRLAAGETIDRSECRYTFAWPAPGVYYISYGVGARWGSYHHGIDISGDKYDKVCASESGTVIRTNTSCPHDYGKSESCGCGGGYGNYIIIDHGNGFITLYGHLTEVDVAPGDHVNEGDLIGLMGSTGFSTGDHLHFEIRFNGYYLNPSAFVSIG